MHATLTLRLEDEDDARAIDRIHRAAFAGHPYSRQNEHQIVRSLRRVGALKVSMVAELDGAIVGHVAISPVAIGQASGSWYGLGPVGVLPALQRQGIGSALVEAALARLSAGGADGCVVVGDAGYYGRFGFAPAPGLTVDGVPQEHVAAIRWNERSATGPVAYHQAFNAIA